MYTLTQRQSLLDELVRRIVDAYQPERIILFGSMAHGNPDDDSDVDMLIVKDTTEPPLERRVHVRRLAADAHRRVPFSPLVLTPDELASRIAARDAFYADILRSGIVLYERR
ncbi:MAG: nucleotidyltransferase domain-containing protein [Chloroflexi bacterium]|nr:nucleotidyltransferase domain-containing protein [Chloroflexota bacterium]